MIDFSPAAASRLIAECEASLQKLKSGGRRTDPAEWAIKLQFAQASGVIDHAGRAMGKDPWTPAFNPPPGGYAAEEHELERVGRFDPSKSSAFIGALEDHLKAMKTQAGTLK